MKYTFLLVLSLWCGKVIGQTQLGLGGNYSQIHTVHHVTQGSMPAASYNVTDRSYYLNTHYFFKKLKAFTLGVQFNSAFSRGNYAFQVIDPISIGFTYIVTGNKVWQLEVAPTVRYTKAINTFLYSFAQGQVAANYSWNDNTLLQKTKGFNVALAPGIGLKIAKRIALELQFGVLGFYDLNTTEKGQGIDHKHHVSFFNFDVSKNAFRLCIAATLGKVT
jgi:hypothetical protein